MQRVNHFTRTSILEIVGLQTPSGRLVFLAVTITFVLLMGAGILPVPRLSPYSWLNIPSPSIGLTRAFWKLSSGDIIGAWQQNKLIFPAVICVLVIMYNDINRLIKSRNSRKLPG